MHCELTMVVLFPKLIQLCVAYLDLREEFSLCLELVKKADMVLIIKTWNEKH